MPLHLFQFVDEHGETQKFTRYFELGELPDLSTITSPCGQFPAKKIYKSFGVSRQFTEEEERVLRAQKKYIEVNRERFKRGELQLESTGHKIPLSLQPDLSNTREQPPEGFDRLKSKGNAPANPNGTA